MKINILYFLLIFCCFQACVDDKSATGSSATVTDNSTKDNDSKPVYLREPVNIVSSTGEDYPKTLKEIGFPVMPQSEVTNVGNTDIENGTVIMQMRTLKSVDQIKTFFKKEMSKEVWVEQEMKIFNGADGALNFQSDKYTARVLIIKDKVQDFRKVAITLNKKINHEALLEEG